MVTTPACHPDRPHQAKGLCHQCYNQTYRREYNAAYWKRRKEEVKAFVQEAKSVPCRDCGQTYPYYVMDFDHRENKAYLINDLQQRRGNVIPRLRAEIAKCDIVCANCHRQRTASRAGYAPAAPA